MSRLSDGFTLIELMVVIVIISVILSFAMLSIGDGGISRKLEIETQRFSSLVQLASEESIMQAKEMGLAFEKNAYHFYVLHGDKWQSAQNDIFRPRTMPPGIEIDISLEGIPIEENEKPQLFILSSGELTPFEVIFKAENVPAYQVTGTATGKVYESY